MNNIVVIGSCNMDITVLADTRPGPGETVMGRELHIAHGGKGANQAVAAARLGANVTMVGCIGDDAYGRMITDNFEKHNINTEYLITVNDTTTGTAHITLAEGDNSIIVIPGANAKVTTDVVDNAWDCVKRADLVMVQHEIPLLTVEYIIRRCYEDHIPLLLNPAPAATLDPTLLDKVTYITPNEHELSALYPHQDATETVVDHGGQIIVTLGSKGVAYGKEGQLQTVPGFTVQPVDTTGAGDTFNGAFATATVNGAELDEALRFGNAAAALSIQKLGAQEGMPDADEVQSFLNAQT